MLLTQDYAFVFALLSTFGHLLGEAPTLDAKKRLSAFIQHVCTDELQFFYQSFKVSWCTSLLPPSSDLSFITLFFTATYIPT